MNASANARVLVVALSAWIVALAACSSGGPDDVSGIAGSGAGGSGSCKNGETVVQQLVSTDVGCDLDGAATQCLDDCELECGNNDFELGASGWGCAKEGDAEYCRCVCEYCRAP
jgi:hypothetical protein